MTILLLIRSLIGFRHNEKRISLFESTTTNNVVIEMQTIVVKAIAGFIND